MDDRPLPPPLALFRLVTGYYVSRAIGVVARLGIADLLSAGPCTSEELAGATGTHSLALRRVLRLLVGAGVLCENDEGRFALTQIGQCLRSEGPQSMRAAVLLFAGMAQDAWGGLMHSVQTGEPAFQKVFGADTFAYLASHPCEAETFDRAMAEFTSQIAGAVAAVYPFSHLGTIVDVGGGNGVLLAGLLKVHAGVRGILFEQPAVAERAKAEIGKHGLASRCEVVGGDFFKAVPPGADAYVLKHVIHDWDDERATAILANCHRGMGPRGRLLVIEGVYPSRIDRSDASLGATSNDVNMLVCTGGRQRTEAEFRSLYAAANFELTRILPTPARVSIIEGRPR